MKNLVSLFVGIAAGGLILSLLVHVTALAGIANPLGKAAWGLHVGIFVVWFPAVWVSQKLSRDTKQSDIWRVTLQRCPAWMRYMTYGFFGYAFVNFALFSLAALGKQENELVKLRGFSGHWMAFYSAALAMLYSYLKSDTSVPRCINGHATSENEKYCATCGQPVQRSPRQPGSGLGDR